MSEKKHHKEIMENLRSLKPEELATREEQLREELFGLRVRKGGAQLENPSSIQTVRRALARVLTVRQHLSKHPTEEAKS